MSKLCELNGVEQVLNVCQTTIVRQAWAREQELTIHGWIYGLSDGLLRDLDIGIRSQEEVPEVYRSAVAALSTT